MLSAFNKHVRFGLVLTWIITQYSKYLYTCCWTVHVNLRIAFVVVTVYITGYGRKGHIHVYRILLTYDFYFFKTQGCHSQRITCVNYATRWHVTLCYMSYGVGVYNTRIIRRAPFQSDCKRQIQIKTQIKNIGNKSNGHNKRSKQRTSYTTFSIHECVPRILYGFVCTMYIRLYFVASFFGEAYTNTAYALEERHRTSLHAYHLHSCTYITAFIRIK